MSESLVGEGHIDASKRTQPVCITQLVRSLLRLTRRPYRDRSLRQTLSQHVCRIAKRTERREHRSI